MIVRGGDLTYLIFASAASAASALALTGVCTATADTTGVLSGGPATGTPTGGGGGAHGGTHANAALVGRLSRVSLCGCCLGGQGIPWGERRYHGRGLG